jgi:hypothetical protein
LVRFSPALQLRPAHSMSRLATNAVVTVDTRLRLPILKHVNDEYFVRLQAALSDALLSTSLDKETNTAMLLSGEIVTAAINLIALGAATSKHVDTPAKLRLFSEECAKRIRVAIQQVQEAKREGKLPPIEVVHRDESH